MSKSVREKTIFGKICSVLFDIFVIPVVIVAFICTMLMFTAKANNQVPSFFGNSIVKIQSGSMEPEFLIGDVLFIRQANLEELKVGDDIAFYGPITTKNSLFTYQEEEDGKTVYKSKIIYHRIVRIIYANNNQGVKQRYFVCKGIASSASTHYQKVEAGKGDYLYDEENDRYYIPTTPEEVKQASFVVKLEDMKAPDNEETWYNDIQESSMNSMQYIADEYVVGVYNGRVPTVLAEVVEFCASTTGIVCLVIVPALIMIVFILIGIIKDVKYAQEEGQTEQLSEENSLEALKAASALNEAKKQEQQNLAEKEKVPADGVVSDKRMERPAIPKKPPEMAGRQMPNGEQLSGGMAQNQTAIRKPSPNGGSAVTGVRPPQRPVGKVPARPLAGGPTRPVPPPAQKGVSPAKPGVAGSQQNGGPLKPSAAKVPTQQPSAVNPANKKPSA